MEILKIGGAIITVSGAIFALINLIKIIKPYFSKKIAKAIAPFHQNFCPAYNGFDDLKVTVNAIKILTLKSLGDRLKQKARFYQEQGFMDYEEKTEIINEFLEYHFNNGNGIVKARVQIAINLPEVNGGNSVDIDLDGIIENEKLRRIHNA